jgi:hypothetical protein
MPINREGVPLFTAKAICARTRKDEIVVDLTDAGLLPPTAIRLVEEMLGFHAKLSSVAEPEPEPLVRVWSEQGTPLQWPEPQESVKADEVPVTCPSCQSPMQSLGEVSIRVGGTSGGWHLIAGAWADLGEDLFPLDVYLCSRCKRVEFFDLQNRLAEKRQSG